jgi:hypothetical protein
MSLNQRRTHGGIGLGLSLEDSGWILLFFSYLLVFTLHCYQKYQFHYTVAILRTQKLMAENGTFYPCYAKCFFYILQIGKTVPFSQVRMDRHNHLQPPYSCQSPFSVDTQINLFTDDI